MKILICVHGYPPELVGGTEISARNLAEGLAGAGHEVLVIAGSWRDPQAGEVAIRREHPPEFGAGRLRIERWTRPDLYADHWHKTKSARVGSAFRETLRRERPDLVHVLHWMRLSRDLVQIAAQENTPALVSLGDSWVSCPLTFRVKPGSGALCEDPLNAMGCTRCAAEVPPRTPWMPMEGEFMEFASRGQALSSELSLAQAVLVPSQSFGERQQRGLGSADSWAFDVQAPVGVQPELGAHPRRAIPPKRPLRLGCWGAQSPLKGTDLLFEAISGLEDPSWVELHLAGGESQPGYVQSLCDKYPAVRATYHGAFDGNRLPTHAVTDVHAMVSASRAPESFGLVLEEARALGMPSLLPEAGAFVERGGECRGCLMFAVGDAVALRGQLLRLLQVEDLLPRLRAALPPAILQPEVLMQHIEIYERLLTAGVVPAAPAHEWYAERMSLFAEDEWDRSLAKCSAKELGLDS